MRWAAAGLPYSAYGKNFLHAMSASTPLGRYFDQSYVNFQMRKRMLAPQWMLRSDPSTLQRMLPDNFLPNGTDTLSRFMYFQSTSNLTVTLFLNADPTSLP